MKCKYCGEEIREGSRVCEYCDSEVERDTPETQTIIIEEKSSSKSIAGVIGKVIIAVACIWVTVMVEGRDTLSPLCRYARMKDNKQKEERVMDETTKQIAESFQCNYTVFEKGTSPELVEQAYKAAFEKGKEDGFYPAIISLDEYAVEWLEEVVGKDYEREEIIAGCKDNGKDILKERLEEYTEDFKEEDWEEFIGEETEGEVLHGFSGYISFDDGKLEADTLLLEIPVKNPWEIIGYLPMGGWNECPMPEEMIAICKYWYEKYKAVPAVFTHDVMEFYAPSGLNNMDSMEAAKEHYAFCTDRIDQGTRTYTVSELAAGLAESEVWYFWWD